MRWLLLFLASGILATVNEPLRCEVFSGYRNDRLHWHIQDHLYSELFRDVEYWENGLTFKVIHRDLSFLIRGAYGTFGESGWTADGWGYFGYAVNLTADRTYKVILTPLIGYSAHFERLQPENLRLVWNGFLFGGQFEIIPGGRLIFRVGYAYNLLHNRFHTKELKSDSGGNMGQTGWGQMDYILNCLWRVGVGAQINYFSSRYVGATFNHTDQIFKLRWTAISGWGQISRQF